jgi:hypothetical protein
MKQNLTGVELKKIYDWCVESADKVMKIFIPDPYDEAILKGVFNFIGAKSDDPIKMFENCYVRFMSNCSSTVHMKDFANSVDDILTKLLAEKQSDKDFKDLVEKTRQRMRDSKA